MVTDVSFAAAWSTMSDRQLRQGMYDGCPALTSGVLLNLEGAEHSQRRAMVAPVFRADNLTRMEADLAARLPHFLSAFDDAGSHDLVNLAEQFSLETAIHLTGLKTSIDKPGLLNIIRVFGQAATLQQSTEQIERVESMVDEVLATFINDYYEPAWCESRGNLPMDTVLGALQAAVADGHLTYDQAIRDTAFFLQASIFSTANSVVHAYHEICAHFPESESRANLASDLLQLQDCIHESLRLHPASPVAMRRTSAGGGPQQVIELERANRDREVFGADAGCFNPVRAHEHRWPFVGLTFGVGHHSCPGRELVAGRVRTRTRQGTVNQVGTMTRFLGALFERGVCPNPERPPRTSTITTRNIWGSYHVVKLAKGDRP